MEPSLVNTWQFTSADVTGSESVSDTVVRAEKFGEKYAISHQKGEEKTTLRDAIKAVQALSRKLLNPLF